MSEGKPRIPPALVLFLLSPAVGELLSGSSPPTEYFTVFGFTVMTLLYGGGALIARELKIKWGKGIGSLLLLGASYGIFEEGLMVASFQNPSWQDIGILGEYGRWLGINWVWAVELTFYHALISITVPILIVELAYPSLRDKPLLHGRWRKIVPVLFFADIVFGYFAFPYETGFKPPIPPYLLILFMALLFAYLAYLLPRDQARHGVKPMRSPRYYSVICFLGSIACGMVFWVLPNILTFSLGPLLVILIGTLFLLGFFRHLASFDWSNSSPLHRHGLVFGSLFVFIIFSVLQEFDGSRLDDTTGMSLVGVSFFIGLVLLRRRIIKQSSIAVSEDMNNHEPSDTL
ncbi:hypothetical protein KQH65_07695 [archaeon]|nr:hypothetical protein [archaeon]